jgi:hypothetical protein
MLAATISERKGDVPKARETYEKIRAAVGPQPVLRNLVEHEASISFTRHWFAVAVGLESRAWSTSGPFPSRRLPLVQP